MINIFSNKKYVKIWFKFSSDKKILSEFSENIEGTFYKINNLDFSQAIFSVKVLEKLK